MGCWNQTCAISQIAITAGTPVVCMFITKENIEPSGGHSPTADWDITFLPFRAKYNDYGGYEDLEEDWNTDYIMHSLRCLVNEKPAGDNQYHERAVVAEELNWDNLQHAIKDNRLQIPSIQEVVIDTTEGPRLAFKHQPTDTTLIYIHAKVWNALAKSEIDGWNGKRSAKILIDRTIKEIEDRRAQEAALADDDYTGHIMLTMGGRDQPLVRSITSMPMDTLAEYGKFAIMDAPVEDIVQRMAELVMITDSMSSMRKHWHPQIGMGSQENDREAFRLLNTVVESIWKEYDEQFDVEDEE